MKNIKVTNWSASKNHPSLKEHKKILLTANAAIWFNKMCRLQHLTPKYIQIQFNGNNTYMKHTHEDCSSQI
jgi:hypothetical protein